MLSLRLKNGRPQTYLTPLRVLFESTILRFFETIVFRCLAQKKRRIYHSCMSKSETLASSSPAPSSSMPSEGEIIRAFEVPSHREEEVRAAYAAYLESVDAHDRQKGRQPDSLLSSFYVPPSRTHCATADRIRSLGKPLYGMEDEPGVPTGSAAATLISRGRWRMLLDGAGHRWRGRHRLGPS